MGCWETLPQAKGLLQPLAVLGISKLSARLPGKQSIFLLYAIDRAAINSKAAVQTEKNEGL